MQSSKNFIEYIKEYKKNSDTSDSDATSGKFISGILGFSDEYFVEQLNNPEIDKDFIKILSDIKLKQIKNNQDFFYNTKSEFNILEDKYLFYQSASEDQKDIIKQYKLLQNSAASSYGVNYPEAKKTRFTSKHDKLITEYSSAWVRQLLRCLHKDIKNWAPSDVLSSTDDLIMECYYINAGNSNYKDKLFLTTEHILAINIATKLYGFKELFLEDKNNIRLYKNHQSFLRAVIEKLSLYNPNGLLNINKSRFNLEAFASRILNIENDELSVYLSSNGFLAIKFFCDLFYYIIENPRILYNNFDLRLIEKLRVSRQNITLYHPDSTAVKLLIDYDGFELFTDYYDKLLKYIKLHNFSVMPKSQLRGFLEDVKMSYEKSKLWEKSFKIEEDFSARYTYSLKHKHDNKKHVFILLDHSSSMAWASDPSNADDDLANIPRWDKAKDFVREYLEDLDESYKVSLILFNDHTYALSGFDVSLDSLIYDFDELILDFDPSGGTNIERAFEMVYEQINNCSDFDPASSQIMIVTDDELNHFDENNNLINKYEVKTGFMGVCPAVFAVSVYLNDDPAVVELGCKKISDTFLHKSPLMSQLSNKFSDMSFVFNIHSYDKLNKYLTIVKKSFEELSIDNAEGVVDIYYSKNISNEFENDELENISHNNSDDEITAKDQTNSESESVDDIIEGSCVAKNKSTCSNSLVSEPKFKPNLMPNFQVSIERPFLNWFKQDIFNPWHDFLFYHSICCFNENTKKSKIAYLPDSSRKIIFSYLSLRNCYVKLDTIIRFHDVKDQKDFPKYGVDFPLGEARELLKTCLTDKRSKSFRDLQNGLNSFYQYHDGFSISCFDDIRQYLIQLDSRKGKSVEFVYDSDSSRPFSIGSWLEEGMFWTVNNNKLKNNFILLNDIPSQPSYVFNYLQSIPGESELNIMMDVD